jgi:chemotaxis family two-component system sensor kinase Cph1
MEGQARENHVYLRIQAKGDLTILADPERMVQILCNLITNAIKFTPREGSIGVQADSWGTDVRFTVRDNGTGIHPKELAQIFEPYWQSPDVRKGAGLGLYITKALIDAHCGRIWVESRVGNGTTFYFTVPAVLSSGESHSSH